MITVFGEGRGFRVVWPLEEMRLAYRLRPVDLLAGVENAGVSLGAAEQAYVARTSGGGAYQRAMQTCHDTRAWAAEASGA